MFTNDRYLTQGVRSTIPAYLQFILWLAVDSMEIEKDYLQVFKLEVHGKEQYLCHLQEHPEYQKEYLFAVTQPIEAKVFIIDDGDHTTMLLADEY
ncbi:DUF960 family protein [Hydrogenoanaerobacterium sp.]|uniref:DUF960 family protein n=1 Tax=Hydrogenoanaerobacterium sp. TaxID=2953763 RepID=UPI002897F971|nr:DUF960 family protein [Hydrogenoanaerobacterium sp.]